MRSLVAAALFLLSACGGEETIVQTVVIPDEPKTSVPDPYCGDGVCDEHLGENKYNCSDCGFNPRTGCPYDGGTCGDGICCHPETMKKCWRDCSPVPVKPWNGQYDPGWIDPLPGVMDAK
jgi:hypothetical protein